MARQRPDERPNVIELVLVRHAQPEWSRAGRAQGDPGLTELGRTQAALLAERLAGERFDEVWVSTARRAQETAGRIIKDVNTDTVEHRSWLHEIMMPRSWDDAPAAEVGRVLRDSRHRSRDDWWDGMPGGETFRDFHARVTIGLHNELAERGIMRRDDGLWSEPDSYRALIVAHAGTNSVILGTLLGLPPEPWEWERFASTHASLTRLSSTQIASGWIFRLDTFSDTAHLSNDLVTT